MSTTGIVCIALGMAVLIIATGAWFSARAKQRQRDFMLALSLSVGSDLVHNNGSRALAGVTPELEAAIKEMHNSPTQAVIQPDDDDPALGGGQAQARLVLTNEAGRTLILRLRGETDPDTGMQKFRVLGYRETAPDGSANRSKPFGSENKSDAIGGGWRNDESDDRISRREVSPLPRIQRLR
jgi:hypothetical protein